MIEIKARKRASFISEGGREVPFYRDAEPVRACGPIMLWRFFLFLVWVEMGRCIIQFRDEISKIAPLVPNPSQLRIEEVMLKQAARRKKIRVLIPKSRRQGASTWTQAKFVFMGKTCIGRNALTVAHSDDQAREIFKISRRIEREGDWTPPPNRAEKSIRHEETGSAYRCQSGLASYAGSGSTTHDLHISELAKFKNTSGQDATALQSLLNSLSQSSLETIVVIESSGQGAEGDWPDRVRAADEPDNEYENAFLPWTADPGNEVDPDDLPDSFEETLEGYELGLLERGVRPEQIMWRRRKIVSEYPGEDPKERVIAFGYDFPLDMEDMFGVKEGLVYPMLRRETHCREMSLDQLSPSAYAIRVVDWGSTKENPFAVGFFYVDPERPAGFTASEKCVSFWREATAYAYDQKGKPGDKWNHLMDGLRMLVVTEQLDCYVHLYDELYVDDFKGDDTAPSDLARLIHEKSGWNHPAGTNTKDPRWVDLRFFEPGPNAPRFSTGVADRSQPSSITQFTRWRIPLRPQSMPEFRFSAVSEIMDGIAQVSNLLRGTLRNPVGKAPIDQVLMAALRKTHDYSFRPRMMDVPEQKALEREINRLRPREPVKEFDPMIGIDTDNSMCDW